MADGREYRVDHPGFVLASATEVPQVVIEEVDGRIEQAPMAKAA